MHKGIICLTRAANSDDAIENVETFLEDYGNGNVWDWYVIGGRWSGVLNQTNCIELSSCIDVVNEWKLDMKEESEKYFNLMLKEVAKNQEHDLSAYYAGLYRNAKYDSFSFESNVYDIDNQTNNPEIALSNPEGWFAVMIDIHN